MRINGLWLGLLAASLISASAQVTVEVRTDQQQYLPGESLPVAVRITNRSGQALRLGADLDWLTFALRSREGVVVPQVAEVPVVGEFELEASKVATKRLDLAPYFDGLQPGRYEILVTVRIRSWDHEVVSLPKGFDVIDGAKLWEREVGVPRADASAENAPEVRHYILQQANYIKGQLRLYLRVTDAYGRTLKVQPVGRMLTFSRPDPQVDRHSNLHLIYQTGPQAFTYTAFNLLGQIIARQTYDYQGSRPRLKLAEDGSISVTGGVRRVTAGDVPTPPSEFNETDTPPTAAAIDALPTTNTAKDLAQ